MAGAGRRLMLAVLVAVPLGCNDDDVDIAALSRAICSGAEKPTLVAASDPGPAVFPHAGLLFMIDGRCRYWVQSSGVLPTIRTGQLHETTAGHLAATLNYPAWRTLRGNQGGSTFLSNGADVVRCCGPGHVPAGLRFAFQGIARVHDWLASLPGASPGVIQVKAVDHRATANHVATNPAVWPLVWSPDEIGIPAGDPAIFSHAAGRTVTDPTGLAALDALRQRHRKGEWPATTAIPVRRIGQDLSPTRPEFDLHMRDVTPYERDGRIPERW
jgi:hypothetical protein